MGVYGPENCNEHLYRLQEALMRDKIHAISGIIVILSCVLFAQPFGGEYNYGPGQNLADIVYMTPTEGTVIIGNGSNFISTTSPTFVDVVSGVLPTAGAHLATKEYVDLAGFTSRDYFISTNASDVGSTSYMYPAETGDAAETDTASPTGTAELMFSFITEAGEPAILSMRTGLYELHTHLNTATGDKDVDTYWTLTKVAADGSSSAVLLMTSELSGTLTENVVTSYETHANLAAAVTIVATDRLVLKIYANVSGSGAAPTVTISMEGSHDCHLGIQAPSSLWQNQGDELDKINAGTAPTFAGATLNGDVHFDGLTPGRDANWDSSEDRFILQSNAELVFGIGAGEPQVTVVYDNVVATDGLYWRSRIESMPMFFGDADTGFDIYFKSTTDGDYVWWDYSESALHFVDSNLYMDTGHAHFASPYRAYFTGGGSIWAEGDELNISGSSGKTINLKTAVRCDSTIESGAITATSFDGTIGGTTPAAATTTSFSLNDTNTQITEDGSGNLTFKDAVYGTKTLSEMGSPTAVDPCEAGVAEGYNDLEMGVAEIWVLAIQITTSSTDWTFTVYEDDDHPGGHARVLVDSWTGGNLTIPWNDLYKDVDVGSTEFHYTFTDDSGANTHSIRLRGIRVL